MIWNRKTCRSEEWLDAHSMAQSKPYGCIDMPKWLKLSGISTNIYVNAMFVEYHYRLYPKDRIDFGIFSTLRSSLRYSLTSRERLRTPDPALSRVRSRSITASPSTPCWSEVEIPLPGALKPSAFCNDRVNVGSTVQERCLWIWQFIDLFQDSMKLFL